MTFGLIETITFNDGGVDTIKTGLGKDIIFGGDEGDSIVANLGESTTVKDLTNIVVGDNGQIDDVRVQRGATVNVQGADADPADIDLIESISTEVGGAANSNLGGGEKTRSQPARRLTFCGCFKDMIVAGAGSNLIIGDSGRITAANAIAPRFASVPMTVGLIETTDFGDGGSDEITTLGLQ